MNRKTTTVIAYIITAVWAVSFMADIILTSYEPSPYIHAIMMVVAGSMFASTTKNGAADAR